MPERLPKLLTAAATPPWTMLLIFDQELTLKQQVELRELVALQFAGQLRRDPNAPQTKPAEPGA